MTKETDAYPKSTAGVIFELNDVNKDWQRKLS